MRISSLALAAALLVPGAAQAAEGLDDAKIAAIVVAANQVDVDTAKLALEVSTNDEVRKFATLMVNDHMAANKAAAELAGRLGVTPEANPTSEGLVAQGKEELTRLRQLTGAAFDAAYVAREVAYHRQVIAALDDTLIPATSNAELKALLIKVRPNFGTHLQHAEQLHATLGSR
jgi:putative membrane protein